ncbi:hypothetical protein [Asaia platycodi]|uniref:hypothetical protein n=1 Tax=Asaia platycodi TaxID=610243 RepID=UPI000472F377|nr:hypothetical protein [Asaia platycodi]
MAVVSQNLVKGATLTASSSSVYTAGQTVMVTGATVANPTSGSVSLSISISRSGSSTVSIVPSRALAANATDLVPELMRTLNAGDQIIASGAGLVLVADGFALS